MNLEGNRMETNGAPRSTTDLKPGIDLSVALKRVRGDDRLLLDLITFFLEDCPQVIESVHVAAEHQNGGELALAAHSLRGLAANFDAHEVTETAGAIEQRAKSGDVASAAQLVPTLDSALARLTSDLCNYQTSHKS